MYLVDTNVVSEARKARNANRGVVQFFRERPKGDLYLAVQTIGGLRQGVAKIAARGDASQAARLAE